jgi:peptidyl-prolyl cis-trans isomerase C
MSEVKSEAVAARHILVEQEYEAQDLVKKLSDGSTFEDLAKKFSKCPSGQRGGDLGEFKRGRMVPAFEEAAFDLSVGQTSAPVRTRFGFHLIQRYK